MEHLWAPWRMDYVAGPPVEGCVLCQAGQRETADDYVVYRGEHNFVILNRFPYNSGHLMVVPYEHLSDMTALSGEQLGEMMEIAQGVLETFSQCLRPDGANLGMNLGRAAGAGIESHLHLHIIPRWHGDTNFITTVGETRVVPQALDACARVVEPILREVMGRRTSQVSSPDSE